VPLACVMVRRCPPLLDRIELAAGEAAGGIGKPRSSFSPGAFSPSPLPVFAVTLPTLRGLPNFCAASEGLLRCVGGVGVQGARAAPL